MEPSHKNQAIWLARGVALGTLLLRLLRLLCAGAGQLRDIGRAHRRLPKRL